MVRSGFALFLHNSLRPSLPHRVYGLQQDGGESLFSYGSRHIRRENNFLERSFNRSARKLIRAFKLVIHDRSTPFKCRRGIPLHFIFSPSISASHSRPLHSMQIHPLPVTPIPYLLLVNNAPKPTTSTRTYSRRFYGPVVQME
ncbi:hypothetical protein AVEN_204468-1 [Araneus ventricosus]|uniref:Uncharacterized protein n=1 Tax=Araneus ventricosus TaxID=182803 RepID=A0A4Y2V8E4_ARAVE|nr:hypothetical protein AVEN_204468-1 [Araneus ventricosus]